MTARLNVNIDHVATVREARKTIEPGIAAAAVVCEGAGADGITVHLRQDRRHIQDRDIELLREVVTTYLNVELAATDEMISFAERIRPNAVSLVPENANEVTTEGGLNVVANLETVSSAVSRLQAAGVFVSIFIDPDLAQIDAAKQAGADQIEICTAEYAELTLGSRAAHGEGRKRAQMEIERIRKAAAHCCQIGMAAAAGHGLTTRNVGELAKMADIEEFNIGHHIISRAIFIGLDAAVREMLNAINVRQSD